MTPFWLLNIAVWSAVLIYMASGAWSAVAGSATRRGDPMRLACFTTAFVILGFTIRWMVAPDSEAAWKVLNVLCAIDGLFIVALGRAYGRGPHV